MVVKGIHRVTKKERAIKVVKKSKLRDPEKFKMEFDIMRVLVPSLYLRTIRTS
jgi:hypothetical protein